MNPLCDRSLFRLLLCGGAIRVRQAIRSFALEMFDEPRQSIRPPIEDEIVAQLPYRRVDLKIRHDLLGMDERAIQARLDAVIQEDGVQGGARVGAQAERNVRNAKRSQGAFQLALDKANALNCFEGGIQELGLPGRQREREIVE